MVSLLMLQSTPRPVTRATSTGAGSSAQVYCHRLPVLMRATVVSCLRWLGFEVLIGYVQRKEDKEQDVRHGQHQQGVENVNEFKNVRRLSGGGLGMGVWCCGCPI